MKAYVYLYAYLIPIMLSARVRGSSLQRKAAQKKTNYRICNKGRINTPREEGYSILILSYPTRSLLFPSLSLSFSLFLHPTPGQQFVLFTLLRRDSDLLSFSTRIPQQ